MSKMTKRCGAWLFAAALALTGASALADTVGQWYVLGAKETTYATKAEAVSAAGGDAAKVYSLWNGTSKTYAQAETDGDIVIDSGNKQVVVETAVGLQSLTGLTTTYPDMDDENTSWTIVINVNVDFDNRNVAAQYVGVYGLKFNGNGHTVMNYTLNDNSNYNVGLFQTLQTSVSDVIVSNAHVTATYVEPSQGTQWTGALVGWVRGGILKNVKLYGSTVTAYRAGGIVGVLMDAEADVSGCVVEDSTITAQYKYVGGIAAQITGAEDPSSECFSKIEDNSVKNVTLAWAEGATKKCHGIIAALINYSMNNKYTVSGNVADNITYDGALLKDIGDQAANNGHFACKYTPANDNVTYSDNTLTPAAPSVAKIGNRKYATLADAANAAQNGDVIEILVDEIDLVFPNGKSGLTYKGLVDGQGKPATRASGSMARLSGDPQLPIVDTTLKNFEFTSVIASSSGYGLTCDGTVFDNCLFSGQNGIKNARVNSGRLLTITNCVFDVRVYGIHCDSDAGSMLVVDSTICGWNSYPATLTSLVFDHCHFVDGTKTPYFVCQSAGSNNLTIKNSDFSANWCTVNDNQRVGVASGTGTVNLINCTVATGTLDELCMNSAKTGVVAIDATKDDAGKYTSGTFVTKTLSAEAVSEAYTPVMVKEDVWTLQAKPVVAKIGEKNYYTLQSAFLALKAGETLTLLADVDLAGQEWPYVSYWNVEGPARTIDGNHKTIGNLTINDMGHDDAALIANASGGLLVKDLTVTNANITGQRGGVIGGQIYQGTFQNVKVENAVFTGEQKCGGIVGRASEGHYLTMTDCEVKNLAFVGLGSGVGGDAGCQFGGLVGLVHNDNTVTISGCKTSGITYTNLISAAWYKTQQKLYYQFVSHPFVACLFGRGAGKTITFENNETEQVPEIPKAPMTTDYIGFFYTEDCANGAALSTIVVDGEVIQNWASAKIGTTKYMSLQEAFNAVRSGETIDVLTNNTESITVTNTCSFTFRSNGHALGSAPTTPVGYKFDVNGDGTCSYGQIVAKVGGEEYASLKSAITAVPANGTVTVVNASAAEVSLTASEDKPFVLDLNGKTLATAITVNGSDLTLSNGTVAAGMTLAGGTLNVIDGVKIAGAPAVSVTGGYLNVAGGTVQGVATNAVLLGKGAGALVGGGAFLAPDGVCAIAYDETGAGAFPTNFIFAAVDAQGAETGYPVFGTQIPVEFIGFGYVEKDKGNGTWTVTAGNVEIRTVVDADLELNVDTNSVPDMTAAEQTTASNQVAEITSDVIESLKETNDADLIGTGIDKATKNDDGTVRDYVLDALTNAAPAEVKDAIGTNSVIESYIEVKLQGMDVTVGTNESSTASRVIASTLTSITYDVKPIVTTKIITGDTVVTVETNLEGQTLPKPVSFKLDLQKTFPSEIAKVTHDHNGTPIVERCVVQTGADGAKWVNLAWTQFCVTLAEAEEMEGIACWANGEVYDSVTNALKALPAEATIVLLKDCDELAVPLGYDQVIDLHGHRFSGTLETAPGTEKVAGKAGTVYVASNDVQVATSPTASLPIRGYPFGSGVAEEDKPGILASPAANGRPVWQNFVLGTDVNLVPEVVGAAEGFSTVVIKATDAYFTGLNMPAKSGVTVKYNLVKKDVGGGDFAQYGSTTNAPYFQVDVKAVSDRTLWKIQTMFESEEE